MSHSSRGSLHHHREEMVVDREALVVGAECWLATWHPSQVTMMNAVVLSPLSPAYGPIGIWDVSSHVN